MSHPEVEIAVLGPIEIRGAAHAFSRSSARELVVYLAFHRQGARNDVWGAALWADRSVALSTLHSTASVARRSLGRAQNGVEHLPRTGRTLKLGTTVGTDVERFVLGAADPHPASWKDALGLVRGRLFEGLRLTDWAVLEGIQARLESLVADTALEGARHFLQQGLGEEAEWIARRGLQVSPYDERLYRALLCATEAMGNRVGLRSAMAELLCVAAEGGGPSLEARAGSRRGGPLSYVHPKTVALYQELTRGELSVAGGYTSRL